MAEILSLAEVEWLRLDVLGRLLLAALLGGLVGLERESSGKPAGFRTNLLICVGAALLTELSIGVAEGAGAGAAADPGRIAAQVVSGIGFLGAGTIIQARGGVVGLTTAATLWVVAAVGMAVGARAYVEAIGTTVLVMAALLLLGRLDRVLPRRVEHLVHVAMERGDEVTGRVERKIGETLTFELVEIERDDAEIVASYRVEGKPDHWKRLMGRLADVDGVRRVTRS